jgi:hypothetical protein
MLALLPSLALAESDGSQTKPGQSRPTASGADTSSKGSTKDGSSRDNGSNANGAAQAQETDSHVTSAGEQGFRRFASLCRDQKAACDDAFRFGALVGADAAMRCALADGRIACFKNTMNSQEFMEEEQKAITRQTDPKQRG